MHVSYVYFQSELNLRTLYCLWTQQSLVKSELGYNFEIRFIFSHIIKSKQSFLYIEKTYLY